jgi:Ca2+-binding RTX toxin-like protein
VLVGNKHANKITGTVGDDTIYGEDGNDKLNGSLGLDALFGGKGNDTLEAGAGPRGVFAYGEGGHNLLKGGVGDDNLIGGEGNDRIRGGVGKDFLSGGAGNDRLMPGAGLNMVDGGGGNDTVDYQDSNVGVEVDLSFLGDRAAGTGGYQGDLIDGVENVVGSDYADKLIGDDGANRINGGCGDDLVDGGGGSDILIGGPGADAFVFVPEFGIDTITRFDADPGGGQDLLGISAFRMSADEFAERVEIADIGAHTLVTIDGETGQTILLERISNAATVTRADFVL